MFYATPLHVPAGTQPAKEGRAGRAAAPLENERSRHKERVDMAGASKTTTDHTTIKHWAEERGGHPATVEDTGNGDKAGVLRLDFGDKDARLHSISWEEFFQKFDQADLAFLYQDKTSGGEESRFFKFVQR
jgi:hypothetical protein